ncbi:hypothetical protein B9Z19DRAFT_1111067 [Tuber borchii]|uniref:Uncharacterized protein n=1 Tax=Tuber borchii TaxID=42251 RepID=A0A2T6ZDW4_TUBBO|nr:hypothetical protein B9Z19DRAFT_1111067 [Tuber borchii]
MFRRATKLAFKPAGICRYLPHVRAITTTAPKNGKTTTTATTKLKYQKAYSKMNTQETEERLGLIFKKFERDAVSISQMLADAKPEFKGLGEEQVEGTKKKIFNNIIDLINVEGYPSEANDDFNKANVNDLVAFILPIVTAFQRGTGRELRLQRERDIITTNFIGNGDHKFAFVVEAQKAFIGQARRLCMLALKEMGDNNPGGVLYGFVTSGDCWRIIRYQGGIFTQTDPVQVVFRTMEHEKEKWLKESSIIVDFLHAALRSGGFVAE